MSTESELRDWRWGSTVAERLCADILPLEGYTDVDPQAPLGGPDGKKDILAWRNGLGHVVAVFFPGTPQTFADVTAKFNSDAAGVKHNGADALTFFVNQQLTVTQRKTLVDGMSASTEIYHLERLRTILDSPKGYGLRLEYLRIEMSLEEQIAFFSELNYDVFRRLLTHEASLAEVNAKLDVILERTKALEPTATQSAPSSLIWQPDDTSEFEAPMSRLSFATLSVIHRLVMEGVGAGDATAGRLRAMQVWIGNPQEPLYVPPDPLEVPTKLKDLLRWWRSTYPDLVDADVPEVAEALANLHHGFLSIHPFVDGNGRVARVLIDQAARELLGRRVGPEFLANPQVYFETLRAADAGDLAPMTSLISAALQ